MYVLSMHRIALIFINSDKNSLLSQKVSPINISPCTPTKERQHLISSCLSFFQY